MDDWNEELFRIGKEILVSLVILGIILGSLYVYSGRWPPMVVIESSSMSHGEESRVGIIDTGDIVVVRGDAEITTYVEGRPEGYTKYGQYGDVIIYRPMGRQEDTPIIHRPIVYIEFNETTGESFDIPSLGNLDYGLDWSTSQGERLYDLNGTVEIYDYGFRDVRIEIKLYDLLRNENRMQSGYITMGDKNNKYDQETRICPAPVHEDWVIGVARSQLPWFGIIKLLYMGRTEEVPTNSWYNLGISLAILLVGPFAIEYIYSKYKNRGKSKKESLEELYKERYPPFT
ncbi:MAG: S26 family signal peptidase [Thermoplasmata archaeon]